MDISIAVFGFNRPQSLARLLDCLSNSIVAQSLPIYIFIDGARNLGESKKVKQVADLAHGFSHPIKSVIERPKNFGLRTSLRDGVTKVLERHDAIIVLEDDLILDSFALEYFVSSLQNFEGDKRIMSICGYSVINDKIRERRNISDCAYFLPMTHPWGWATWRDRWQDHLEWLNSSSWKSKVPKPRGLRHALNVFGIRNWAQMFEMAEFGYIDSWWIYWHFQTVVEHRLSLFPSSTLVRNEGIDGTGTHASKWNVFRWLHPKKTFVGQVQNLPSVIAVDYVVIDAMRGSREARFERLIGFLGLVKRKLKRVLTK